MICILCRKNKPIEKFAVHNKGILRRTRKCLICRAITRKPRYTLFLEKVNKTDSGCWIWTGAKSSRGYGYFQNIRAHRFSYEYHREKIPSGKIVMHKCDVPLCVNPEHLIVGTYADNSHDRDSKGRTATGRRSGSYKHGRRAGIHRNCRYKHVCGAKRPEGGDGQ